MNNLKVGFARVDVTPMTGIPIRGYFQERLAESILDPLEITALALACGESKAVILSLDSCGLNAETDLFFRTAISEATDLPLDAIFLTCTHTHTAPYAKCNSDNPLIEEYTQFVKRRFADVVKYALADLKPARMGWGIGNAPNIAFVRRFRMKDGSVRTNPGVNNPDILHPIGDIDERVTVLRFDREGAETLVLANFGNHPDVVGGCKISADWPGMTRRTVEKSFDNVKCIVTNGAQGDLNHVNVHPTGGYLNDMFIDFDDVARGYNHAQYMARVVTGGVMQCFDKVQYVDIENLRFMQKTIQVGANKCDPSELPEAHRINDLHLAGRDDELPYEGMMLTTKVAEAGRKVRLADGPDYFDLLLSGIMLDNIALIGIPGEPFMGVGKGLKETEGWDLVIPSCLTNGDIGYFPMMDAYIEGGYEAGSSPFKAGTAEQIISEGQALLRQLKEA